VKARLAELQPAPSGRGKHAPKQCFLFVVFVLFAKAGKKSINPINIKLTSLSILRSFILSIAGLLRKSGVTTMDAHGVS